MPKSSLEKPKGTGWNLRTRKKRRKKKTKEDAKEDPKEQECGEKIQQRTYIRINSFFDFGFLMNFTFDY